MEYEAIVNFALPPVETSVPACTVRKYKLLVKPNISQILLWVTIADRP
jgi:hypothetical protein